MRVFYYKKNLENRVKEFSKLGVAQFGRAGSLGLSGRRFDPCHLDQILLGVDQLVDRGDGVSQAAGSSPVA